MGIGYASEKLYSAVQSAIVGTDTLQERLHGCYLSFHTLTHERDLPAPLQARFDKMIAALGREPDPVGKLGTVAVTTSHMSDDECRRWLEEILSLYTAVVAIEAKQDQ